jgi:hypothetical protein
VTLRPLDDEDPLRLGTVCWGRFQRGDVMRRLNDRDCVALLEDVGGKMSRRGRTAELKEVSFDGDDQLRSLVELFKQGKAGLQDASASFRDDPYVRIQIDD